MGARAILAIQSVDEGRQFVRVGFLGANRGAGGPAPPMLPSQLAASLAAPLQAMPCLPLRLPSSLSSHQNPHTEQNYLGHKRQGHKPQAKGSEMLPGGTQLCSFHGEKITRLAAKQEGPPQREILTSPSPQRSRGTEPHSSLTPLAHTLTGKMQPKSHLFSKVDNVNVDLLLLQTLCQLHQLQQKHGGFGFLLPTSQLSQPQPSLWKPGDSPQDPEAKPQISRPAAAHAVPAGAQPSSQSRARTKPSIWFRGMWRAETTFSAWTGATHIFLVIFYRAPNKGNDSHLVILALAMLQSQLQNKVTSCLRSSSRREDGREAAVHRHTGAETHWAAWRWAAPPPSPQTQTWGGSCPCGQTPWWAAPLLLSQFNSHFQTPRV